MSRAKDSLRQGTEIISYLLPQHNQYQLDHDEATRGVSYTNQNPKDGAV